MEQSFTKNWIYIGFGALLIIGARWVSHHWMSSQELVQEAGFSYEMPRPKSYAGGFDLSSREVERDILSDEELTKAEKDKKDKAALKALPKASTKLNQAGVHKQAGLDQQKLTVNIVDTRLQSQNTNSPTKSSVMPAMEAVPAAVAAADTSTAAADSTAAATDSGKKSAAEWLSTLSTAPTASLIAEFEQDHKSGSVNDATFYNVAFTLLTNSNQQQETTGSEILSGDTGSTGFVYLASEESKVSSTALSAIKTDMNTYATAAKLSGLNAGLNSGSAPVVTAALTILTTAVENSGLSTQSGAKTGAISASALQAFVGSLTALSKGNSTNATEAAQLLSQIQSSSTQAAMAEYRYEQE
jgi:hypothetical protein